MHLNREQWHGWYCYKYIRKTILDSKLFSWGDNSLFPCSLFPPGQSISMQEPELQTNLWRDNKTCIRLANLGYPVADVGYRKCRWIMITDNWIESNVENRSGIRESKKLRANRKLRN